MSRVAALWEEWADEDPLDYGLDPIVWGGSPVGTVTFPTTPLKTRVMLAIGADLTKPATSWAWTDVTDYVRGAIAARVGRPDEGSQVQTSSAQLVLSNRDGRFSRRNPNSPYFGQLTFNTPIWATVDAGSGMKDRIQMFVNEWPVRWDPAGGGTDSTVAIQCAGVLRRLQQGAVLKSAMRRAVLSAAEPTPAGYWPCEDGTDSTLVASGLAGGLPMVGGPPVFGSAFGGTSGSLDLNSASTHSFSADVPLTSTAGFQVECIGQGNADFTNLVFIRCGPLAGQFQLALLTGMGDGKPHHLATKFVQNGSNIDWTIYTDGVAQAFSSSGTIGPVVTVTTANINGPVVASVAHIAVYQLADADAPTTRAPAATGYNGEMAHTRIKRLAAEEGVPMMCAGTSGQAMGVQPVATFLDLIRECEAVDNGVLYETQWGLGYKPVDDLTNQPVSLALDFNKRHIADDPQPADDDQRLRNDITANRANGSWSRAEQLDGPLGTGPGGPGVYNGSVTVNVATDRQLDSQASWRLHLGIVDEDRWPSVPILLHASTDLIDAWTAMPFGGRLTIANPLPQVPPFTIDAVLEGWTESWDALAWVATLTTSPFSPFRVSAMAQTTGDTSEFVGWMDFDSVTLATAVDSTATSWSVNASPIDAATSDDLPRNHRIGAEVITITAVSGLSAPQTWTVTRSVNGVVKAHAAGETITLERPFVMEP